MNLNIKAFLKITLTICYLFIPMQAFAFNCQVPIASKVCYIDTENDNICASPPNWLKAFDFEGQLTKIYAISPPLVQQTICNIDYIYVAKQLIKLPNSAYAIDNKIYFSWASINRFYRPYKGYRWNKEVAYSLGSTPTQFSDWEALGFSLKRISHGDLPINYALANTLFHELAHVIRNQNFSRPVFENLAKHSKQNSVIKFDKALNGNRCKRALPYGANSNLLKQLETSEYVSFYAACNLAEDFAETFSTYLMQHLLKLDYSVFKNGKQIYNLKRHLDNLKMQPKLDIVRQILE